MNSNEEKIVVGMPNVKKTCERCKYGLALGPYMTSCAYFKRKPHDIYYEGKGCPYFRMARKFENNNENEVL